MADNKVHWEAANSRTSGISSESINAGANNLGDEIDNATNQDRFASGDLVFTCSTAPDADKVWNVYFLYAKDGTNYEDGGTSVDPTKRPVVAIAARAVTSAQRVAFSGIPIYPFKFKVLLQSELNQNATAVTLDLWTHNEEVE